MAVNIADPFDGKMPFPIDMRTAKTNINDRNAIDTNSRYWGLMCFVRSEGDNGVLYVLGEGLTNSDWHQVWPSSSGGSGEGIVQSLTFPLSAPTPEQGDDGDIVFVKSGGNYDVYQKVIDTWGLRGTIEAGDISDATSTVLGGIRLFSDAVQSVAANAVTSAPGRTFGVQMNASGQAVVNVPAGGWVVDEQFGQLPSATSSIVATWNFELCDIVLSKGSGDISLSIQQSSFPSNQIEYRMFSNIYSNTNVLSTTISDHDFDQVELVIDVTSSGNFYKKSNYILASFLDQDSGDRNRFTIIYDVYYADDGDADEEFWVDIRIKNEFIPVT